MYYSLSRGEELSGYLYDGILEIDNNLVENAIRQVALGYVKLHITSAEKTTCLPARTIPTRRHDLFVLFHL